MGVQVQPLISIRFCGEVILSLHFECHGYVTPNGNSLTTLYLLPCINHGNFKI
jgi:hypothetical protein